MKKSLLLKALIGMAAITLMSCIRQPEASFVTDKSSYMAGETVILTNTSLNGDHYVWTMPDGSTVTTTNATYQTNACDVDNSLYFQLDAYSKFERKTDEVYHSVDEHANSCNITFWTNDPQQVDVTLSGFYDQTITYYYTSSPNTCDAYGCANFDGYQYCQYLDYSATDGTNTWSGTLNTNSDCICFELELAKSKKASNPTPGKSISCAPVPVQKVASNAVQSNKITVKRK